MKYLSLFSGIGGFELGITKAYEIISSNRKQQEGSEVGGEGSGVSPEVLQPNQSEEWGDIACVGYSEIDPYATSIYQKHFPEHKNYGDITKLPAAELPDFDLLVGGFPCQAFSIAGQRGGFQDTRGTLFFEIARILQAKQPRLFVLENVKGLLSHSNGETFKTIIATLDELGYDLQWQVLNSKNHGVPQNRERVFIVGHLRGTARPQVFPFTETNSTPLNYIGGILSEKSKKWLEDGKQYSRNFPQGSRVYGSDGISSTLASQAGGLGAKTGLYAKTIRSGGRSSPHGSKQNWDSYEFDGKIRRLTPTECERLQGFPDGWTEGVSDTQRYKCLGNAVTVNVIEAIMTKLL